MMDRDRRLTGYLRGQSDRPIAPAGFEFSNGWRVRRLPASFPPSAMSAPRADPVSRSRSVSSNAAAPSRNETSIQNTIALHVSLVSLFLFFLFIILYPLAALSWPFRALHLTVCATGFVILLLLTVQSPLSMPSM